MKKIMVPIIVILFLSSFAYAFTDTDGHWADKTINRFESYNIIKGYETGEFLPNQNLTRAEVATIINRMIGTTKESSRYIPDVTRGTWYYSEIRKAIQSGIIQGDAQGYIRPLDYITREEAVVIISRAFAIEKAEYVLKKFEDSSEVSAWAREPMEAFVNYQYLSGYADNTIRPKDLITRAELVTILDRIFGTILTGGIYSGDISGSVLVLGKNVALKDVVISNNLVIAEGAKETLALKNVHVKGNLVLREEPSKLEEIHVSRKLIHLYAQEDIEKYESELYGITFSIPNTVNVVELFKGEMADYRSDNLLLLNIEQKEEYYLRSLDSISEEILQRYDNNFSPSERGTIGNYSYVSFVDYSIHVNHRCIIIKRDNTVYALFFANITADNLVDNVLATVRLTSGEMIHDRNKVTYHNRKLNLKFLYREGYIGVDDSYNTGMIYSGDAPLKLFIQVNLITDMQSYSRAKKKMMLKALVEKDGELLREEDLKVYYNDAFQFVIKMDDDKIQNSLYIVIGNNLYHLILVADQETMNEVGEELFEEVINSIEF